MALAIAARPDPKNPDDAEAVLLSRTGQRWVKASETAKQSWKDSVTNEFSKVLLKLGLKRPGLAFYALRHTTETVGGEARDQPALDLLMGRAAAADDMGAVNRERIGDQRLKHVTDVIHDWLSPR